MRISVVVPTFLYKHRYPAPLSMSDFSVGLAYIAGALRAAGHEVFGCNPNNLFEFANAKEMAAHTISQHIERYRPDIVCTGGLCTDYDFLRDCISIVRAKAPRAPIIIGGGIVGYDPKSSFELLKPDYAVKGDGEHTVVQLVDSISRGREPAFVSNLLYWKDGKTCVTPENFDYAPIENLPYPDFDVFDAQRMLDSFSFAARPLYRYPHLDARTWVVVAGRGCPFRCTFCVHDRPTPYDVRSPADVVKELVYFREKYDFNVLIILDELFAPKRARLVEFSQAMQELRKQHDWDLKWCFQTHANVGLTQDDINLAKDAGCYMFSYGMESASETVLKSMKKKSRPRQIAEVIPMCKKAGVGFGGNYIFGDPAETPETIKETMTFFKDHCRDIFVGLGEIQPFPGSALYANCIADGTIESPATYYETIEARRYQMAKFPESAWRFWCTMLDAWSSRGLWHLRAPATVSKVEQTPYFRTMLLDAECPHCALNFSFKHVDIPTDIPKDIPKIAETPKKRRRRSVKKMLRLAARDVPWLAAIFFRWRALKYPWLGHLSQLVGSTVRILPGVVTGCPHCNQCVRLEWSATQLEAALNIWPQNTGNSMHFVVGDRSRGVPAS